MLNFRSSALLLIPIHVVAATLWVFGIFGPALLFSSLVLHIGLITIGSFRPGMGFYLHQRSKGTPGTLALTYDDGPSPGHTEQLLDLLDQEGVKATFFCIGRNVQLAPELAKRIAEAGHAIGVHTQDHPWTWGFLSRRKALAQIQRCVESIRNITKMEPRLFRAPFGVTSPNVAWAIRKSGLEPVAWDLRTFDTVSGSSSKKIDELLARSKKATIVVMHDRSALALPLTQALIRQARENGTAIVPLTP